MNPSLSRNAPRIDQRASRARQQSAWASGDYAVVGNALQIVGEELCETMNLYQDARVLDVAVGNGAAALAAARRWCDVTSTDFAPDLANRARQRSEAENLGVRFVEGDAEALPFPDQSFDAVVSTFGAMFAPDQERAASEMIRVCRRGGSVGLSNWTPDGFIGQLFRLIDRHVPAESTGSSPTKNAGSPASCWSWWRASIGPRTAPWSWMRSTSKCWSRVADLTHPQPVSRASK